MIYLFSRVPCRAEARSISSEGLWITFLTASLGRVTLNISKNMSLNYSAKMVNTVKVNYFTLIIDICWKARGDKS